MNADKRGVCAVTGAGGYVGSQIVRALEGEMQVVTLTRGPGGSIPWSFESSADLAGELRGRGVKVLIHAAWDMRANSLSELERVCVRGSRQLFDAAQAAGVERIIFVSTISAFAGCRSAYGRAKLAVEGLTLERGGVVLRLGLVYGDRGDRGDRAGGMFGNIRRQVQKSRIVPLINAGLEPQYLLHERTLGEVILRAARGDFDKAQRSEVPCFDHSREGVLTIAHPQPWPFRTLVQEIARKEGRTIRLIPVSWRLLYLGLRCVEAMGVKAPFRSDSVMSFVHYNRQPDFSALHRFGISPLPFRLSDGRQPLLLA